MTAKDWQGDQPAPREYTPARRILRPLCTAHTPAANQAASMEPINSITSGERAVTLPSSVQLPRRLHHA